MEINQNLLMQRLQQLGDDARDSQGVLSRSALTDQDKSGRDLLIGWMKNAGMTIAIDAIGNIFGLWRADLEETPLMIGSHIDSVINAGIYDGCYGVLAGLAVVEALQQANIEPLRPIIVAAFSNEEGNRYAPDMMGSLVYAGGLDLSQALETIGTDGSVLGEELRRIGYDGDMTPGEIIPHAYLELHIEQGPVLEAESVTIGAVENLQGISWQEVTIKGVANHAGTTPTGLRHDAGLVAARIVTFLRDQISAVSDSTVATVGSIRFFPYVINVIPSQATLSVDLRDPDESRLQQAEQQLEEYLNQLNGQGAISITTTRLARFEPVQFDQQLVAKIEAAARDRSLSCRRMTSGAGHDAQMMARICPSAMIFTPSRDGISHNPKEFTEQEDLIAAANVLLDVTHSIVTED